LPRRLDGKQTAMPQLQEAPSSYLIMLMIIFLLFFPLPLDFVWLKKSFKFMDLDIS
jgi:hypothetical protein